MEDMALHESLPAGLDIALALNTYACKPPLASARSTSTHLWSEMGSRLDSCRWSVAHIQKYDMYTYIHKIHVYIYIYNYIYVYIYML